MVHGVTVREFAAHEWPTFRALRLSSLADAPDAFATTLAEAEAQSEASWREQLAWCCASPSHELFVAEHAAKCVGLAFTRLDEATPTIAHLGAMWVAPSARRLGAGRALVMAVVSWARGRSAREIELQVTEGNAPAERLYASTGFVRTEEVGTLPSNPALRVRTLRLALMAVPHSAAKPPQYH